MRKLLYRTFTLLWVGVFLFILGEVIFQLFLLPLLEIRKVVVETDLSLSRANVLRMSGINEDDTYFSVHPGEVEESLGSFPSVQQATVSKKFPNSIYITLKAREGIAVIFIQEEDGNLRSAVVDEEGVLFAFSQEVDLPVISGVVVQEGRVGQTLPIELTALLLGLYTMKKEAPELYATISECRVSMEKNGGYEVFVYPLMQRLPVRMSLYLEYASYENALFAMGTFSKEVLIRDYREIDVKGNQLVLHRRGVQL